MLAMLVPSIAVAQSAEEVVRDAIGLYDEVTLMGEQQSFMEFGFGMGGPHHGWLVRAREVRDASDILRGTPYVFCGGGNVIQFGMEMMKPSAERDAWIIDNVGSDFESCRQELGG